MFLLSAAVQVSAAVTNNGSVKGKDKKRTDESLFFFYVGIDLFSREAALQVFSARMSLTTVFGMGTGGPSA